MTVVQLGHNNPPSEFEEAEARIEALYGEAKHWADGAEVDSEEIAEGLSTLINELRKAGKDADKLRKDQKQPHLEAGKAVDAQFKPLTDKVKRATDACKAAMVPWLRKLEEQQRAEAEEARRLAEEQERAAQEAALKADRTNLDEVEAAEEQIQAAKAAEAEAKKAERAKANTANRGGKAIGLRTVYTPVLEDPAAAFFHYTPNEELNAVLLKLAGADVRAGKREIPGFTIKEEKRAV